MIQDIFPHHFNNHYDAGKKIGDNDLVFHFINNTLLMKNNGELPAIPRKRDLTSITEATFLFTLDDVSCFLVWDDLQVEEPDFVYKEINFFRTINQSEVAWISFVAYHLRNWYAEHRFCGKCGANTHHKSDERALECPDCHTLFFPKISPAIIVAIVHNDKILLARNTSFPSSWYSLIAGYADVGETLEETLRREVKEEVGLNVTNIRYYKSQPWPLSGSMMVGFVAEADENQPIAIDHNEIATAGWFTRGNLPNHSSSTISIAGEMIEKFEHGEL